MRFGLAWWTSRSPPAWRAMLDLDGLAWRTRRLRAGLTPDLMAYLLRKNCETRFGAFGVSEAGDIELRYSLVGSTSQKEELRASVQYLMLAADFSATTRSSPAGAAGGQPTAARTRNRSEPGVVKTGVVAAGAARGGGGSPAACSRARRCTWRRARSPSAPRAAASALAWGTLTACSQNCCQAPARRARGARGTAGGGTAGASQPAQERERSSDSPARIDGGTLQHPPHHRLQRVDEAGARVHRRGALEAREAGLARRGPGPRRRDRRASPRGRRRTRSARPPPRGRRPRRAPRRWRGGPGPSQAPPSMPWLWKATRDRVAARRDEGADRARPWRGTAARRRRPRR